MARVKHTTRLIVADEREAGAEAEEMAGDQGAAAEAPVLNVEGQAQADEGQEVAGDALAGQAEAALGTIDAGDADQVAEGAEGEEKEDYFEDGHLVFGPSQVSDHNIRQFRSRGYIADSSRCRSGGSATTPDPREDEVVIFDCFF